MTAMDRMKTSKPMLAAQGVMMCVVAGKATEEEKEVIRKLGEFDDPEYRVAGRSLHDWIAAAMDVLGIMKCNEPEGSDVYDCMETLRDPNWLGEMKEYFDRLNAE